MFPRSSNLGVSGVAEARRPVENSRSQSPPRSALPVTSVDAATVEMLGGRRTDEVEQDAVHGAVAKLLAALRDGKLGLVQLDRDLV